MATLHTHSSLYYSSKIPSPVLLTTKHEKVRGCLGLATYFNVIASTSQATGRVWENFSQRWNSFSSSPVCCRDSTIVSPMEVATWDSKAERDLPSCPTSTKSESMSGRKHRKISRVPIKGPNQNFVGADRSKSDWLSKSDKKSFV